MMGVVAMMEAASHGAGPGPCPSACLPTANWSVRLRCRKQCGLRELCLGLLRARVFVVGEAYDVS